ncbi:MAG: cell division protein ZapA [Ruminococcaceae bacterium]|nr:cell division protein ZapA [Oscillospiraceae bacterium]
MLKFIIFYKFLFNIGEFYIIIYIVGIYAYVIINHFTHFFKTVFLFFERQVHIMKQKYTITIADIEMNVITEEPPEFVDELVGIIDRKIREINTASRRCSKNEAALLCALDYCSDKMKMQKKIRSIDAETALKNAQINRLTAENEKLRALLEKNGIRTDKL